jgi:hypothetical protein
MIVTLIVSDTVPYEPQLPPVTAQTQLTVAQFKALPQPQIAATVQRLADDVKRKLLERRGATGAAVLCTDGLLRVRRK